MYLAVLADLQGMELNLQHVKLRGHSCGKSNQVWRKGFELYPLDITKNTSSTDGTLATPTSNLTAGIRATYPSHKYSNASG